MTGYFRGAVDDVLSRIIEAFLALPVIIMGLLVAVAVGPSRLTLILIIGLLFAPIISRTVRAAVLGEREMEYVSAARLRNERTPYILFGEILPNVTGPIIVEFTVRLGYAIFIAAGLSFLGFGIPPPAPDWGLQVAENYGVISGGFWWTCPVPEPGDRHARHRREPDRRRRGLGLRAMTQESTVAAPAALELTDLEVAYRVRGIWRPVLRGVSFTVAEGESYGLVGESGCGKSTAAYAVLRYLPRNGRISSGTVTVAGEDLAGLSEAETRKLRASKVSMVYQNPGGALNPTIRIGDQVAEVFTIMGVGEKEADERAREMLRKVQISDPDRVMRRYAHQLSGGMQQRVVIAMALAKDPTLLILDEPTTGLDATVEAEVLELVSVLREEFRSSVLFISHNLDVITKMCDRVGVLYAGRLVEEGPVQEVFDDPRHPYAVGLLRCLPRGGVRKDQQRLDTIPGFLPQLGADLPACVFVDRCGLAQDICSKEEPPFHDLGGGRHSRCHFWEQAHELPRATPEQAAFKPVDQNAEPVIRAESVNKTFRQEGQDIRAVDDMSFVLRPGETLGLVGESGSGKTTLARTLLGLTKADEGSIIELDGRAAREGDHQARARRRARAADRLPEPGLGAQPALLRPAHPQPRAGEAARRRRAASARSSCRSSPTPSASTRA